MSKYKIYNFLFDTGCGFELYHGSKEIEIENAQIIGDNKLMIMLTDENPKQGSVLDQIRTHKLSTGTHRVTHDEFIKYLSEEFDNAVDEVIFNSDLAVPALIESKFPNLHEIGLALQNGEFQNHILQMIEKLSLPEEIIIEPWSEGSDMISIAFDVDENNLIADIECEGTDHDCDLAIWVDRICADSNKLGVWEFSHFGAGSEMAEFISIILRRGPHMEFDNLLDENAINTIIQSCDCGCSRKSQSISFTTKIPFKSLEPFKI